MRKIILLVMLFICSGCSGTWNNRLFVVHEVDAGGGLFRLIPQPPELFPATTFDLTSPFRRDIRFFLPASLISLISLPIDITLDLILLPFDVVKMAKYPWPKKEVEIPEELRTELWIDKTPLTTSRLQELSQRKHLTFLSLQETNLSSDDLKYLSNLTNLKTLILHSNPITDEGLVHLSNLKNLQTLSLIKTNVTPAGLQHFSTNTSLKSLYIADLVMTNELVIVDYALSEVQLTYLEMIPNLKRLRISVSNVGEILKSASKIEELEFIDLSDTDVTDDELKHLSSHPNLKEISLVGTHIDEGLAHLAKLPLLEKIKLGNSVTDKGIKYLSSSKSLKKINIRNSEITDRSLGEITALKKLAAIQICGTKVTKEGMAKLKQARPKISAYLGKNCFDDFGQLSSDPN